MPEQTDHIRAEPARRLGEALLARGLTALSVESCTGGMVAAYLTSLAGSSEWFEGAFVTYRLSAKQRMVGLEAELLAQHGAVSEPTARAMAEGALRASNADLSVAITGVAGPGGGDVVTPVGTVWFAWASRTPDGGAVRCVQTARHRFAGDRAAVRAQAVNLAVAGWLQLLESG